MSYIGSNQLHETILDAGMNSSDFEETRTAVLIGTSIREGVHQKRFVLWSTNWLKDEIFFFINIF